MLWNSPFDGCLQCSSPQLSAQTAAKFSITANQDMAFVGDKIALNYAITAAFPGLRGVYSGATPCWALEADKTNCSYTPWTNITVVKNGGKQQTWRTVLNLFPPCTACRTQRSHVECCGSCTSGVPQAADVQAVAAHAAAVLTGDPRMHSNFSGLLVLDFEAWRPVSADNDALYSAAGYTLSLYTQYGRQLVQEQHPEWDMERVTAAAIQQFDAAAETMVTAALVACKLILPHAKITLCKQRPRSPPPMVPFVCWSGWALCGGFQQTHRDVSLPLFADGFPGMISPIDTHPASFAGNHADFSLTFHCLSAAFPPPIQPT